MIPHNPDANITMPHGMEQDCIRYASDPDFCNRVNARDRHCRVRVKQWKKYLPSHLRLDSAPMAPAWDLSRFLVGQPYDPYHPFRAIA